VSPLGFLLGLLCVTPLVVAYVLFVRWCDRFEPEPWWLIVCAFLWGAVFATTVGGTLSGLADAVFCRVMELYPDDSEVEKISATVFAPVFEEGAKGLGVMLVAGLALLGMRELDGPLDGAIYGGVVGLGFTLTEDILYVAKQFAEEGLGGFAVLLFLRTVLLGLSHCTFTACTGLGFGIAVESRSVAVKVLAPMCGFALAVMMHAMHNGLPSYFGEGGLVLMLVVSWIIDVGFFGLLAALVVRDRRRLVHELQTEIGVLLHASEAALISTYLALSFKNVGVLFSRGYSELQRRREKQLALVQLAFLKDRQRRGDMDEDHVALEATLRERIMNANRSGVFLG
jgi:protease PrsW